jgi:molybdenum cofactor guanylyltransferase
MSTYTVEGFVLCGGASRRMGSNKAFLNLDGAPLAQRVALRLQQAGCARVRLIGKDPRLQELGFDLLLDQQETFHPLQGVVQALIQAESEHILIVPCDLPFLSTLSISKMLRAAPPACAEQQPLFAHLHKESLSSAQAAWQNEAAIFDFMHDADKLTFEEEELLNINHPQDFLMAKTRITQAQGDRSSETAWSELFSQIEATIDDESWPQLPEILSRAAPIRNIFEQAGSWRTIQIQESSFSIYGFPDLHRRSSKLLLVRPQFPLPQIISLHNHPQRFALGLLGECTGFLEPYRAAQVQLFERLSHDQQTLEQCVGIEGDKLLFLENRQFYRWNGHTKEELGTFAQALPTLLLSWL